MHRYQLCTEEFFGDPGALPDTLTMAAKGMQQPAIYTAPQAGQGRPPFQRPGMPQPRKKKNDDECHRCFDACCTHSTRSGINFSLGYCCGTASAAGQGCDCSACTSVCGDVAGCLCNVAGGG